MIALKNIAKKFKRRWILENINITFPENKITALVGANGVGKTTLLKIILGLERPNSGQVFLYEEDISKLPIRKRVKKGISYMSQQSTAITDLTVETNVYLIPKLQEDDEEYREGLLTEFNLQHVRHQKCKTLSGGELQKLEFCLCMATRPKVILLDEPFAGLDPKTTKLVIKIIKDQYEKGVSMIVVDHRVEELKQIAEEYVLLNDKSISFQGSKEEFYENELVGDVFLG